LIQRNPSRPGINSPTPSKGKRQARQPFCQRQNGERGILPRQRQNPNPERNSSDFDIAALHPNLKRSGQSGLKTRQENPLRAPTHPAIKAGRPRRPKGLSPHKFLSTLSNNTKHGSPGKTRHPNSR